MFILSQQEQYFIATITLLLQKEMQQRKVKTDMNEHYNDIWHIHIDTFINYLLGLCYI